VFGLFLDVFGLFLDGCQADFDARRQLWLLAVFANVRGGYCMPLMSPSGRGSCVST